MFKATWLLRNGDRVQSRDYLTLDQIEEYTFKGETILALEGISALLEPVPSFCFTLGNIEFFVLGGVNA